MKKILSVLLAAVIAAGMSACGAKDKEDTAGTESSSSVSSQESSAEEASSDASSSGEETAAPVLSGPEYEAVMKSMYEGTGKYADAPVVVMETSMGTVKIRLFPDDAPKAVENFLTHAKEGYYDGLSFHRVIKDFMIQGGDPQGNGTGGTSIWDEDFGIEYSDKLWHLRGCLSMANRGPDSNGSQFFIVQGNDFAAQKETMEQIGFPQEVMNMYEQYGGMPHLDYLSPQQGMFGYTKFGYVFEGMDVIDKIAMVKTDSSDKPADPVTIVKMTVEE